MKIRLIKLIDVLGNIFDIPDATIKWEDLETDEERNDYLKGIENSLRHSGNSM